MTENDIRTIIETDDDYRKRLLTTDWEKWGKYAERREMLIHVLIGLELDALGVTYRMHRIHTHICSPPKGPVA